MAKQSCAPRYVGLLAIILAALAVGHIVSSAFAEDGDEFGRPTSGARPLSSDVAETLTTHCATCHGTGLSKAGAAPAGRISAIGDLDWLASSTLVVPGEPDRSRLFAVFQERHAPLAHFTPAGKVEGPTSGEVMRLRRWISQLPQRNRAGCDDGRGLVTHGHVLRAALEASSDMTPARAAGTRFLSLAHIWNACATARNLSELTAALQVAVSGLTWRPQAPFMRAIPIDGVDGQRLPDMVFAVSMDEIGVAAGTWDRATAGSGLSFSGVTGRLRSRVGRTFGSDAAVVAADAFVWRVYSDMQLYSAFLRLPDTADEVVRRLGISNDLLDAPSHVLEVPLSPVTGGARILKRYRSRTTTVWVAEESGASQSPGASQPLAGNESKKQSRALFRLPNDTLAFAVFGRQRDMTNTSGLQPAACISCHANGPRRPSVEPPAEGGNAQSGTRGASSSFSAFASEVAGDVMPVARTRGLDPVSLLISVHEAPVDVKRAAAELGQSVPVLTGVLSERIATGDWIARRLSQGQISRAQFETLRLGLLDEEMRSAGVAAPRGPVVQDMRTGLAVWTEHEAYAPGRGLKIYLRAESKCYPTVINVDGRGAAIVLYPNGLDDWRPIEAGAQISLPPAQAEYEFRTRRNDSSPMSAQPGAAIADQEGGPGPTAAGPGDIQTLHAFCGEKNEPLFAMKPDYQLQVFTILGDWEAFLKSAYDKQRVADDPEVQLSRQDAARRRSLSRRRQPKAPIFDLRPQRLMRDAATFEVR